jgi:hypothetical protein
MALTLTIKPPEKVIGSMSSDEQERTPVLLGLDVQEIDGDAKLVVDVAFQRIPVRGPVGMGPWYVAASDAQLTLRANGAKIASHRNSRYVDTVHRIKSSKEGKVKAEFEPKVEVSETLTVSVVSAGGKATRSKEETIEYSDRESTLTAVQQGDRVVWVRSTPKGEKLIREYILENLHLWLRCKWTDKNRRGSAVLITFPELFHSNGKKFSKIQSFFAGAFLRLKPPLTNEDGTSVEFTCDEK